MNYKVKELAELSGVSVRTLHWYDRIGLLTPQREENGYRSYSTAQVDRLQEILFYRQMGIPLEEIKMLLSAPDYDRKNIVRTFELPSTTARAAGTSYPQCGKNSVCSGRRMCDE